MRPPLAPAPRIDVAGLKKVFITAGESWSNDNASRLAAAFSFYAILSLAPLLVLAVAVATNFLDAGTVRQSLLQSADEALGAGARDYLATMIESANKPGAGTIASVLSVLLALFGASNLFGQLAESINSIWGIRTTGNIFRNFLLGKLASVVMVLIFALLVMAWMVLDSVLGYVARTNGSFTGWGVVSFLVSVIFLTFVFALAFKALPRNTVGWQDVWVGAVVTAIGFAIAKFLLGLYFGLSHVSTAYGSAGALVVILLWFYYTGQIFFFGAELTCTWSHVYGKHRGEPLGDRRRA